MRTILIKLGILTIALAMVVGVATAAPADVKITPQNADIPYEPGYVTYNVEVYDILDPDENRAIVATIVDPTGMTTGHLQFRFTNSTSASDWRVHGQSWTWGKPQNIYYENGEIRGYEDLTMEVRALVGIAPENVEYVLRVEDISLGGEWDTAYGTTFGSSIPEFTTIAGPVGAIMGLFLFFNYRKRRKE